MIESDGGTRYNLLYSHDKEVHLCEVLSESDIKKMCDNLKSDKQQKECTMKIEDIENKIDTKTYIITQQVLTSREYGEHGVTLNWTIVTRKVEAVDSDSAVGKFVSQTKDIKSVEKLNLECIELCSLKTIK